MAITPHAEESPILSGVEVMINPEKEDQLIINLGNEQNKLNYTVGADGQINFYHVDGGHIHFNVSKANDDIAEVVKTQSDQIKSPMPGTVAKIFVTPGQQVHEGDALISIESMKMEFLIKATHSAVVAEVRTGEGKFV